MKYMGKVVILVSFFLTLAGCAEKQVDVFCKGSVVKHCEPTVFFDYNSTDLDKYDYERLIWVVSKMKKRPHQIAVVTGYADMKGSSEMNKKIALERAEAVKEALVDLGVSPNRIRTESRGKEELVTQEEDKQQLNRRVKITFEEQ